MRMDSGLLTNPLRCACRAPGDVQRKGALACQPTRLVTLECPPSTEGNGPPNHRAARTLARPVLRTLQRKAEDFSASSSRRVKRLSLSPHIMAVAQTCSGPVVGIKSSCVYALRLCPALQWRRVPCKSQELSGSLFLVRFQPRHRHPTFEKIVKPAARV